MRILHMTQLDFSKKISASSPQPRHVFLTRGRFTEADFAVKLYKHGRTRRLVLPTTLFEVELHMIS